MKNSIESPSTKAGKGGRSRDVACNVSTARNVSTAAGKNAAAADGLASAIEMRQISKVFHTTAGDFTALKEVSACFYKGEFVSVVGKSGSGKSTLVNMITGIDRPTSGEVFTEEGPIHALSENRMSIWRGRNLGVVFQFFQLLPTLTLLENVMLPMDFAGLYSPGERPQRALELLRQVGLEDFADQLPAAVSGGQQQSVAIARALANDPPILVADEPTGNLDSRTAEQVFSIFTRLAQQGKTIIVVTHDASLAQRTDRTLLLCDGELVDPRIAGALPRFAHRRLLWLTHKMQPRRFEPGEALPRGAVILVTAGEVEAGTRDEGRGTEDRGQSTEDGVRRQRKPKRLAELVPQTVLRLGAGNGRSLSALITPFDWGMVETLHATSLLLATSLPVEALVLEEADFQQWMEESPSGRAFLEQAAIQRWGRAE
jgi:putative ABC transport system ATP-binding protein